jgi:hypothetical protein
LADVLLMVARGGSPDQKILKIYRFHVAGTKCQVLGVISEPRAKAKAKGKAKAKAKAKAETEAEDEESEDE